MVLQSIWQITIGLSPAQECLTWNTQPALLSGIVDNVGAFGTSTWVEYNVTSQVTGNGTYTFALVADSTDGVTFSSREGTPPPQLVVITQSASTGTATFTPTSTATFTPTPDCFQQHRPTHLRVSPPLQRQPLRQTSTSNSHADIHGNTY